MEKKQILLIAGFILLLISIPATLYLVKQQQTLKSRASFVNSVEFLNNSGQVITETNSQSVRLRLTHGEITPTETVTPTITSTPTLTPTPTASVTPTQTVFVNPTINSTRVDFCLNWGANCGQPAADEFCIRKNFNLGAVSGGFSGVNIKPTLVLGNNLMCNADFCFGFSQIECRE